jgi:hypothetical protein
MNLGDDLRSDHIDELDCHCHPSSTDWLGGPTRSLDYIR